MTPFLSIITRCYKRPKQLERCIASVRNQTKKDYEQLFINDEEGKGLYWANCQIHRYSTKVNGEFVYILDDDDFLIYDKFIEDLKEIVEVHNPNVIICKGYIGGPIYPKSTIWGQMTPKRGAIGSPNFIVRKEFFHRFSSKWMAIRAGDYHFISAVFGKLKLEEVYWWDKVVFKAPVGGGLSELQRPYTGAR